MSPQLKKGRRYEHIEWHLKASQGDIFNNVTGQYWEGSNGIVLGRSTGISSYQTTKYLEFIPREQGGGFQGELAANDPMVTGAKRDGSKEVLSNGNELVKSDQTWICLIVGEDGSFQPAVIDMKSSQLKVKPSLEDPDRNAEDQEPKDRSVGYPCCVRHNVEVNCH